MNANFGAILDKPSSEVSRPPPLPVGEYVVVLQGLPKLDKTSKKQTEFCEFTVKFLQALDSVDADALAEVGGITDKERRLTFYLTDKSAYRLKEFMVNDLQIEEEGKTLRQMLDETPGRQFIVTIKHTATDDGKGVFDEITSTAPVA